MTFQKHMWPGLLAPSYNANTWDAEAGKSLWVLDQTEFHNETVSDTHRKNKQTKQSRGNFP